MKAPRLAFPLRKATLAVPLSDRNRRTRTPSGHAGHRRQVAVGMRQHQRLDLPGS